MEQSALIFGQDWIGAGKLRPQNRCEREASRALPHRAQNLNSLWFAADCVTKQFRGVQPPVNVGSGHVISFGDTISRVDGGAGEGIFPRLS